MNQLERLLKLPALRWSSAISWTLLLSLFLLQPEADPLIDLGLPRGPNTIQRELFFSALHLLAFALTCFIWYGAFRCAFNPRNSLVSALLVASALGLVTEALQTLTLDRHASAIDLIANVCGALIAAWYIRRGH